MAEGTSKAFERMLEEEKQKEIIDDAKMPLQEWINLLTPDNIEKYVFTHWCFPTIEMKNEYIATIDKRTDREVKDLIRNFLIPSGSLNKDVLSYEYLKVLAKDNEERFNELLDLEFYRRLLRSYLFGVDTVWEGNTWVLDLLPDSPKEALNALEAYFLAHIQQLPDGRWDGLQDAIAVLRAKFIQTPTSSLLRELNPYQLEHLADSLYSAMGYNTALTPRTHDGAVDIIGTKDDTGNKEKVIIQCKQKKKKVTVSIARELLWAVSEQKANKGILIAPNGFTSEVKKIQRADPRLELLGNQELQILLNTHCGSTWSKNIDYYIAKSMRKGRPY